MAMTPFSCRRRIRVISSSTGSSTVVPGDLRIRFPHVVGRELENAIELLPLEPRNGQLDQSCGGRERMGGRGELDMVPSLLQRSTVHQGAVADQEDILPPRLQL